MLSKVTIALALVASRCGLGWASGSGFLAELPDPLVERLSFLDRLEGLLGSDHDATEARLAGITEALRPTVLALPKTARGALSASSARYALHRLFVQRHGWQLQGVASAGDSPSASAPVLGLSGYLPGHVRHLFVERFDLGEDFDLEELALLAAALETLIHGEVLGRLRSTYGVLQHDVQVELAREDAEYTISTFMESYIMRYNISQASREIVERVKRRVNEKGPFWKAIRQLQREVQDEFASGSTTLAFSDMTSIVEGISERIGRRIDEGSCRVMEGLLVRIEDGNGTGRVKLRDFYASNLYDGNTQFVERMEYLRQLGALDESDPAVPRLIIPNYLSMDANCIHVSSYYDLCCTDRCAGLMGHIERHIRAAHAAPDEILEVVSALPSAHLPGNRTLSPELVMRLDDMARHHGGQVPLHGRLFAQWMHFAYPRECPYPHVSGTTRPITHDEWVKETGRSPSYSRSEMQTFVDSSGLAAEASSDQCQAPDLAAMWEHREELVDVHSWNRAMAARRTSQSLWSWVVEALRAGAFLVALASSAAVLKGVAKHVAREAGLLEGKVHFV